MSDVKFAPSVIRPNSKANVVIVKGLRKGQYSTTVDRVEGDTIACTHPMYRGTALPIYKGMEFEIHIEHEGAKLIGQAVLQRVISGDGAPLLSLKIADSLRKTQQRNFFRADCFMDGDFFPLDFEASAPMKGEWASVKILDISLGGARLKVELPDNPNSGYKGLILIKLYETIYSFTAKAARIKPTESGGVWEISFTFDALPSRAEKDMAITIQALERAAKNKDAKR